MTSCAPSWPRPERTVIEPFWLPGCQGALYALHYPPATGTPRAAVLCVSPFAEEMNKARRMQALQARQLAAAGFGVLIADPYGTGDSAGEFEAARWDDWRADLLTQVCWLHDRGYGTVLPWGVRLGALLAMELAVELAAPRLLLWQPVSDGSQYLRQFLRLRLAAERLKGSSETLDGLQTLLAAGQSVEVAGYMLHPQLAAALAQARLQRPMAGMRVDWFELASDPARGLVPLSTRLVADWRQHGVAVEAQRVQGDPFWATQDISCAPALLAATVAALTGGA